MTWNELNVSLEDLFTQGLMEMLAHPISENDSNWII